MWVINIQDSLAKKKFLNKLQLVGQSKTKLYLPILSFFSFVSPDYYDALICSGAFGEGHVPCTALTEFIRLVKPGRANISYF